MTPHRFVVTFGPSGDIAPATYPSRAWARNQVQVQGLVLGEMYPDDAGDIDSVVKRFLRDQTGDEPYLAYFWVQDRLYVLAFGPENSISHAKPDEEEGTS